ncbi:MULTISPECIES: helix-turn-helix domain-containing protein [Bradyrhizobium]|uniref:LuxR C-terminal-related transcriptional regulator n=2 Tax=Bradyrhizobium TaxID=374 RepID=UPI0013152426
MALLSAGLGPKHIAGRLGICTHTARVHSGRIMTKMGAQSIADLVRIADKIGQAQNGRAIRPDDILATSHDHAAQRVSDEGLLPAYCNLHRAAPDGSLQPQAYSSSTNSVVSTHADRSQGKARETVETRFRWRDGRLAPKAAAKSRR